MLNTRFSRLPTKNDTLRQHERLDLSLGMMHSMVTGAVRLLGLQKSFIFFSSHLLFHHLLQHTHTKRSRHPPPLQHCYHLDMLLFSARLRHGRIKYPFCFCIRTATAGEPRRQRTKTGLCCFFLYNTSGRLCSIWRCGGKMGGCCISILFS